MQEIGRITFVDKAHPDREMLQQGCVQQQAETLLAHLREQGDCSHLLKIVGAHLLGLPFCDKYQIKARQNAIRGVAFRESKPVFPASSV
jgi:hypothetical protein